MSTLTKSEKKALDELFVKLSHKDTLYIKVFNLLKNIELLLITLKSRIKN